MPFDWDKHLELLKQPDLSNEQLMGLLADAGLPGKYKPKRIFPLGVVVDDGRRVEYRVPAADVGDLLGALSQPNVRGIRSYRVFPLGVVAPGTYRIEVDLGQALGE